MAGHGAGGSTAEATSFAVPGVAPPAPPIQPVDAVTCNF